MTSRSGRSAGGRRADSAATGAGVPAVQERQRAVAVEVPGARQGRPAAAAGERRDHRPPAGDSCDGASANGVRTRAAPRHRRERRGRDLLALGHGAERGPEVGPSRPSRSGRSASSLGIAHSDRPPSRDVGESTQMSVIRTCGERPVATSRATSSSW